MNISEIALRRLDGAYFNYSPDSEAPSYEDLYIIGLLGFKLEEDAEHAFDNASSASRRSFIDALEAQLPNSMVLSLRQKALQIRSGSEYKRNLLGSKFTTLKLISIGDLESFFERLVTQPLPYSEQDISDLKALSTVFSVGGLKASARENNAVLAGLFESYDWTRSMTVTDALRVAAVWSGGDATLTVPPRFKLKRSQRREIALALEEVLKTNDYAFFDFARHKELWKRLFKVLHVSDYPTPNLQGVATLSYQGQLVSVDSLIEYMVKNKDLKGLLIHFKTMPGVFARRLHEVIRKMPNDRDLIIEEFTKVADRVSTRVLVQLYNYYNGPSRSEVLNLPFSGNSRTARNGFLENRKAGDYSDVMAAIEAGLKGKLNGKSIHISNGGSKIGVMTSNRSSAMGSRPLTAGSRVALEDPKFITLFSHWKNSESGRVDLDLSAMLLSEDLQDTESIAYYSTNSKMGRYSGDIVDAPNGAEEYIVLDVEEAKQSGYRYAITVINSYTGQSVGSIPECYSGVASATSLDFNSFDAAAVESRFDLASNGREVIPLMVDLKTMELIWVDMVFPGASSGANMSSSSSLGSVLQYIINYKGLTVEQLVEKSGGKLVDKDSADLVIDARMSDQVAQLLD